LNKTLPFWQALSKEDQEAFDSLFDRAKMHTSAGVYMSHPCPMDTILLGDPFHLLNISALKDQPPAPETCFCSVRRLNILEFKPIPNQYYVPAVGGLEMDQLANRIRLQSETSVFERRKFPRFSNALPIEYWQADNPRVRLGYTTNICEGGLMVSLPEGFGVGEKLRIKIFFVSSRDLISLDAIEVTAIVVWSDADGQNAGHYRNGMKFEDIAPENRDALRHFLNRFGQLY